MHLPPRLALWSAAACRALAALAVLAVLAVLALVTAAAGAEPPAAAAGPEPPAAVVLMYHRFGDAQYPSTNIRMEQFRAHLRELRRPQYHVLPLPRIVAALRSGESLPERTVGISMDDAYRSIYSEAWPLLKEARLPFTVFVASDGIDRGFRDLMTWAELRELAASGLVTLGNHTATHLHMADAGTARNRDELQMAAARIEAETGQAPTLLAYPYGESSLAVRKLAQQLGFVAAFGQQSGAIGPDADPLLLPRFALNEHYGTPERFRLAVNALPLPVRDAVPQDVLLDPQHNPPLFGFTVPEGVGALDALACYVSEQGRLTLQRVGARRVEGRPARPFPPGRSRINCTLPGPQGRWRWYGVQFYLPGS
jgi:poly-beta-1,6-N-acetyl-D-glucosamine N-deacetylase